MDNQPAIHLENVVFRYQEKGKRNILDGVCLDIKAGSVTLIMGSSGCGKSTLAAVLAGLYPENGGFLETGTIELFGRPLSSMTTQERARYLSIMFQNPDLQFCMGTLRKEMQFCLENLCIPVQEMDGRISRAARELGVAALLDRDLHTLSGGEKQKAVLACLYVMQSRCIVLDECFANIDEPAARQITSLLARIHAQGRTIIAIDHRADLWLDLADRIILLGEGGHVVADGITRDNIGSFREAFEKEGVLCAARQGRREDHAVQETDVILRFRDLGIPQSPAPKKWFRKAPQQTMLLAHADAQFYRGAMHAVLGPSGCGKTSTFLAVLKQHPYTGTIELGGQDIASMHKRALYRQIGIVFQNPSNQFISQNVEEEILDSLKIWEPDISGEASRQKADELLEGFGLKRYARHSPYMLSQGQQRRLAVLSVLSCGQQILLLDEPTYGQDERSTAAIMDMLRARTDKDGLTVIFITHDRALAGAWADHIYEVRDRKLAMIGREDV